MTKDAQIHDHDGDLDQIRQHGDHDDVDGAQPDVVHQHALGDVPQVQAETIARAGDGDGGEGDGRSHREEDEGIVEPECSRDDESRIQPEDDEGGRQQRKRDGDSQDERFP